MAKKIDVNALLRGLNPLIEEPSVRNEAIKAGALSDALRLNPLIEEPSVRNGIRLRPSARAAEES